VATASGRDPGLRVSDADRDAVVTELGRHFQDGRLDQSEFGERMSAALCAKTEGDLAELLADLPRSGQLAGPAPTGPADRMYGRPPLIALLPIAIVAFIVAGLISGGWHHGTGWSGWPFAPFGLFWLVIPFLVIRTRFRGARQRQFRSERGR